MPEIIRVLARGELRAACMSEGEQAAQMAATPRLLAEQGAVLVVACYRWERQVFLYYECVGEALPPEQVVPELAGYLAAWPGQTEPRSWIPMIDVFHFNDPASLSHWQRKQPVERRVGRVAHLKPEMAAKG